MRRQGGLGRRLVFSFVTLALVGLGGSGWVLYRQALTSLEEQLASHLLAEAEFVAADLGRGLVTRLIPGMDHMRLRETQMALGARRIYAFDHNGRSLVDTEVGTRIGREVHLLSFHRRQVEAVWRGELAHTARFTDEETGDHYMTGYAPIYHGSNIVAGVGGDID